MRRRGILFLSVLLGTSVGCEGTGGAPEPVTPIISKTRVEHPLPPEKPVEPDEPTDDDDERDEKVPEKVQPKEVATTERPRTEPPKGPPASEPLGCRNGERKVGPLCVSEGSVGFGVKRIASGVYFADDPEKKIVWDDVGYVESATRTTMLIIQPTLVAGHGMMDLPKTLRWNGTKFVEKGQAPLKAPKTKPAPGKSSPDNPFEPG